MTDPNTLVRCPDPTCGWSGMLKECQFELFDEVLGWCPRDGCGFAVEPVTLCGLPTEFFTNPGATLSDTKQDHRSN